MCVAPMGFWLNSALPSSHHDVLGFVAQQYPFGIHFQRLTKHRRYRADCGIPLQNSSASSANDIVPKPQQTTAHSGCSFHSYSAVLFGALLLRLL